MTIQYLAITSLYLILAVLLSIVPSARKAPGSPYTQDGIAYLDCIVSVVDALRLQTEFDGGKDLQRDNIDEEDIANLIIQQIEFCNIILLNKASEVSAF